MNRYRLLVLFLFGTFALAGSQRSAAQWVTFSDDTATRLTLDGVATDDAQEKDIAVGDLNRDGLLDVIVVRKTPFSNPGAQRDVLLINEDGVLVDRTILLAPGFVTTPTDARDVVIADFDGDGWLDVVVANTFTQQPSYYRNLGSDGLGNWLGLADESSARFPVITVANMAGPKFCAVAAGDLTGNGAMDIYFANYNNAMGAGTTDVLLINDGTGHFTDETAARLGNYANVAFGTSVEIHDMDEDGDNDVVRISTLYAVAPFDDRWMGVFYNDGTGVLNTHAFQEFPNVEPYMITVADFNGDGLKDIYQEGDNADQILIATTMTPDTDVSFNVVQPVTSPRTAGFGGNTKIGDVDNDGDWDIGVAPIDVDVQNCGTNAKFSLLENPGNGRFFEPWASDADQNFHIDPHDFAFLDVNGDGCLDMFMGLCTGWKVFVQTGCTAAPAGVVPAIGPSLTVDPGVTPGELQLDWTGSCQTGDDYAIYRGSLGLFTSHEPVLCSTGGLTDSLVTDVPGDHYYLVVPQTGTNEGSYGSDHLGYERLPAFWACASRAILDPCP